jgi:hypothetical protein
MFSCKKNTSRESQGSWRQDGLVGGELPVVKQLSDSDSELSSVVTRWPAGNDVNAEAEECPLLEAVTRKRLVETVTEKEH